MGNNRNYSNDITAESKKIMFPVVLKQLQEALDTYYKNPSEKTMSSVYDQLINCYVFEVKCILPGTFQNGGFFPKAFMIKQTGGSFLGAFTPDKADNTSIIVIDNFRTALNSVLEQPKAQGLILNPDFQCPLVLIPTAAVREIVRIAEERLGSMFNNDMKTKYTRDTDY